MAGERGEWERRAVKAEGDLVRAKEVEAAAEAAHRSVRRLELEVERERAAKGAAEEAAESGNRRANEAERELSKVKEEWERSETVRSLCVPLSFSRLTLFLQCDVSAVA